MAKIKESIIHPKLKRMMSTTASPTYGSWDAFYLICLMLKQRERRLKTIEKILSIILSMMKSSLINLKINSQLKAKLLKFLLLKILKTEKKVLFIILLENYSLNIKQKSLNSLLLLIIEKKISKKPNKL